MNSKILIASVAALLAASQMVAADEPANSKDDKPKSPAAKQPAPITVFKGEIKRLAPLLGTWEIDGQWSNGTALWARNEYRVGLGGRFVDITTIAKDGEGDPYERYRTVFAYDEDKKQFMSYGFVYNGSAQVVPFEVGEKDGRLTVKTEWTDGYGDTATELRQSVTMIDDKSYRWQVWMKPTDGEWTELIDGQWNRVDAAK